jgi:6-phosphogluconolactonase
MKIDVPPNSDILPQEAAKFIAARRHGTQFLRRGRFSFAVSGGWLVLRALAGENIPWNELHLMHVDERVFPAGDPDRNLTHLRDC